MKTYPEYGEYRVTYRKVNYNVSIHYQGATLSRQIEDGTNIFWSFNDRFDPIFRGRREIKNGKLVEGSGLRVASADWNEASEILLVLAEKKGWLLEKKEPMSGTQYLEKLGFSTLER